MFIIDKIMIVKYCEAHFGIIDSKLVFDSFYYIGFESPNFCYSDGKAYLYIWNTLALFLKQWINAATPTAATTVTPTTTPMINPMLAFNC